jgi:hypothetical protein
MLRFSTKLLKLPPNLPRHGKLPRKSSPLAPIPIQENQPSLHFQPESQSAGKQWLLYFAGMCGFFVAFALISRLFPQRVYVVHKDEYGNIINK